MLELLARKEKHILGSINDLIFLIELERAKTDPKARLKSVSNVTRDVLNELDKTYKSEEKVEQKVEKADKFNAAPYSTGKVAASFTSTAMNRETVHEAAIIEEDVVRYSRVKKKGNITHLSYGQTYSVLFNLL